MISHPINMAYLHYKIRNLIITTNVRKQNVKKIKTGCHLIRHPVVLYVIAT